MTPLMTMLTPNVHRCKAKQNNYPGNTQNSSHHTHRQHLSPVTAPPHILLAFITIPFGYQMRG